jgi:hypothetical protein
MEFVSGLLWGSGISLGFCVGLVTWAIVKAGMDKVLGVSRTVRDINERSIAALERRNELTVETNNAIWAVVEAMVAASPAAEIEVSDDRQLALNRHGTTKCNRH